MKYYTIRMTDNLSFAFIGNFRGIDRPWQLKEGRKMGDAFRSTVRAKLDKRYGRLLTDYLSNLSRIVPVSEKMKSVLEDFGLDDERVEFLPFELYDQDRRRVPKQYYVANALEKVRCIDQDKSQLSLNSLGEIQDIERLHICHRRVPTESCFFRLAEAPAYIIIRDDLLERLKTDNITGLEVCVEGERIW